MRYRPLLVLVLTACGSGSAERRLAFESQREQNLVGTWDATLSLLQPYRLGLNEPAATRICGTIGFVANRHPIGGSDQVADAKDVGAYDLDLSRLGLNWLDDSSFPTAVATNVDDVRARVGGSFSDSIAIVLNPGSQERIVLLGRSGVAGITGRWTAQSSRGTANGSFSLTPHTKAWNQPPGCSEFH